MRITADIEKAKKICNASQRLFMLCFMLLLAFALVPVKEADITQTRNTAAQAVFSREIEVYGKESADERVQVSGADVKALPQVSAQGAALISGDTGELIFGKNSNGILPMASTTKIMTALVVLERCSPDEAVTIAPEACGIEGSSIYLVPGEKLTVRDLLYGLLLESGNDAAVALAIAACGGTQEFTAEMNKKASELGLTCTSFANPHGLSAENHHTTAAELAKITYYAMKQPLFREIVSTVNYTVKNGEGVPVKYFTNHNRLLRSYSGANGVKTGYTLASGRCLVTSAERDGSTFIAVTLNDRNDWRDHEAMLDYAFGNYRTVTFFPAGGLSLSLGGRSYCNCEAVCLLLSKNSDTVDFTVTLS